MHKNSTRVLSFLMMLVIMTSVISFMSSSVSATSTGASTFVNNCYEKGLGRSADSAGFTSFTNALDNHTYTASLVAYKIFLSSEYMSRKRTDSQFVDDLYLTLLGRPADSVGKSNFISALNSGSPRAKVMVGILNSTEFANICNNLGILQGYNVYGYSVDRSAADTYFIYGLYTNVLGRVGSNAELINMTKLFVDQYGTASSVAYNVYFSPEYTAKNKTAAEFVADLYTGILGRTAIAGEIAGWANQITTDPSTRFVVYQEFVYSAEFQIRCNTLGIIRGDRPVSQPPTVTPQQAFNIFCTKFINRPYQEGSTGPYSFDNPGFSWYIFKEYYNITLPKNLFAQSLEGKQVYLGGSKVSHLSSLKFGDLIFYDLDPLISSYDTVAIYLGSNKIILASKVDRKVKTEYYSTYNVNSSFTVRRLTT